MLLVRISCRCREVINKKARLHSCSRFRGHTLKEKYVFDERLSKMIVQGASLVAQWLRICLLMQGTWIRALVWEDPTCRGATRPVSHNY